jgi:hypothetical protein
MDSWTAYNDPIWILFYDCKPEAILLKPDAIDE